MSDRKWRVDCWSCGGEGENEGDCTCGESCCCCADPQPPACSHCQGRGFVVVSELTDDNAESAIEIFSETHTKIGDVNVSFTFGRIPPRAPTKPARG